ncbi:MAG: cell wall-active antibiotics response protein [Acidimicrobiia bacterium]|nr:cell wall-active antibiotics response protein [Acidimicrobiia bacterium]
MNWGRLYVGSVIVAVGVILLLDNLDVLKASDVFASWWPVFVIVAGLLMWIANPRRWAAPLIVTAVGVALLLSALDIVDVGDFLWPAILVFVGLLVIFRFGQRDRTAETKDTVSNFTVFSGSKLASRSQHFEGGSLSVLFGGIEFDLSNAELAPDATIEVFTAFGATEITVPAGWHVDLRGFPIFGGLENATKKDSLSSSAPTLVVNATAMFGAVEIKH